MPVVLFADDGTRNRSTPQTFAQDLQFRTKPRTIRSRNRPAKQVGGQRWLNQHSMNRGSTRQSVPCAVSASPECLTNRGELRRPRTGSPAHHSRPSGSAFYFFSRAELRDARASAELRMLQQGFAATSN